MEWKKLFTIYKKKVQTSWMLLGENKILKSQNYKITEEIKQIEVQTSYE